jgi:hypothetical protein
MCLFGMLCQKKSWRARCVIALNKNVTDKHSILKRCAFNLSYAFILDNFSKFLEGQVGCLIF